MKKNYFFLGMAIFAAVAAGSCKKPAVEENQTSQPEESVSAKPESYSSFWTLENLKLREAPRVDGKEIQIMWKGTMVQILDRGDTITLDGITDNWVYVQTEDGEKGWCFGGYLADAKEKAALVGYWVHEAKQSSLIYLFSNGEYQSGIFEKSGEFGTWVYAGGGIIQVEIIGFTEEEKESFAMAFAIMDNDTVKFGDKVFKRIERKNYKKYGIRA